MHWLEQMLSDTQSRTKAFTRKTVKVQGADGSR